MHKARLITNTIQTPQLLYTVVKNVNRQKRFIQKNIEPGLIAAKKINDGSLEESDIKKITGYYGLAVPAILGEAICALRGKKMTDTERLTSTCQGGMTGLGDDFFDKQRLSDEAVKEFIEKPDQIRGDSASEKLFLHFYKTALANAPNAALMKAHLYKVYFAQLLSKKQGKKGLGYEEIKDITLRKGAESLIFYRTAFTHAFDDKEEKMLYSLGALMQLGNDIFDIYQDLQNGISTLLTTTKSIKDIRLLFLSLLQIGYEAAYKTKYKRKNIKRFLDILSIGIFSRCLVCLDQLEKNEKRSNKVFEPLLYKRKDLVCDMDTAINKWRSVKYHIGMETLMTRI